MKIGDVLKVVSDVWCDSNPCDCCVLREKCAIDNIPCDMIEGAEGHFELVKQREESM